MTDLGDEKESDLEVRGPRAASVGDLFLEARYAPSGIHTAFGRLRSRTFVSLRWIAVIGQTGALLFVAWVLGYEMPLGWCLALIAMSAWINVFLMYAFPEGRLAYQWEAACQHGYDIFQLAALLALTGGLSNPFLLLLLVPVTLAAASLNLRYSILLTGFALICVLGIWILNYPLPYDTPEGLRLPFIIQIGHFVAIATGLVFTVVSAWRVSREEGRLVQALDAAQVVLAKEQRLSALGALAAATAHELGTPLATIHLVAREMSRSLPEDSAEKEDVDLIATQAERCRTILRQIAEQREAGDAIHARLPLRALINEAASPHHGPDIHINIVAEPFDPNTDNRSKAPIIMRSPEILHATGAFIENAVSFADTTVDITAKWSDFTIEIVISDDGPGFAPSVLPKLGEPYISERSASTAGGGDMGLGFFIAKTLLERTSGRLSFYNKRAPLKGAVIKIAWSRSDIEADRLGGNTDLTNM